MKPGEPVEPGVITVVARLAETEASRAAIGVAAPVLLATCRLGQGLGLGGEWGGAVLLAIENAPPGRRAWYGMFPQLGAPLGFFCSGGIFLVLSEWLTDDQFFRFGWRIPFLASALLVIIGLYVRLTYLTLATVLTLIGLLFTRETKDDDLTGRDGR